MKHFLFLTFSALALSCSTPQPQAERRDLCARSKDELAFVHQTMKENSANYNGSTEVQKNADAAFAAEQNRKCASDLDYVRGIKSYLAAYHDPHVTALFNKPDASHAAVIELSTGHAPPPLPVALVWTATGVYLQRYNDRYFIKAVDQDLDEHTDVAVGDELLSCSGQSPREILDHEILPYLPVSAYESALYRFTPLIFYRWDQKPGDAIQCEVSRSGRQLKVSLPWRQVSDDYLVKKFWPHDQKVYEIEKTPSGHWVKLHTLASYDEKTTNELKKFVSDAKLLRSDRLIVVDLRGNTGGNSTWGTDWIDTLFGSHVDPVGKVTESVFVSLGNRAHYEGFYAKIKAQGAVDSKFAQDNWDSLLRTLKTAPNGTFAPQSEISSPRAAQVAKSSFRGQIVVLTDWNTFSSAETFLEQLKMMPQVKQAGIASNASTYFSDIRFVVTPEGVPFNFPTKMDSGDPLGRKSGQALRPDWPLSYDVNSELRGQDSLRAALEKALRAKR